jgi:all-trans-retinol dehydrogenase (NAD+)
MAKRPSPLKVLAAPIKLTLSDFRLQLPLLLALLYYPDRLKSIVPERLYFWISSARFLRGLKVLLGLNITRFLNDRLSRYVVNNWKKDAKWINSQEVVLITGGSSGIGELAALDFAKRGVKVISLDLNPPKKSQRELDSHESPISTLVY